MSNWIVIVDDDSLNLKTAGHILSKNNMKVTALRSGQELLGFMESNTPDLILLDIMMPDMDGFETLSLLREKEKELQKEETPVVFLTAEEDKSVESKGFEVGISDFVRKPFDPSVLIRRIENVLNKQEQLMRFHEEATLDKLTGLYNKATTNEQLEIACNRKSGYLMMIDMDSFKLVNDLYGHEMGDQVLSAFANLLQVYLGEQDIIGRMGGDEFAAFSTFLTTENDLKKFSVNLNAGLLEKAKTLMGESMNLPLGASIGAVKVSGSNGSYKDSLIRADKALYKVKQNGKHGYSLYGTEDATDQSDDINLKNLSMILSERNVDNMALKLDMDSFIYMYRYVMRYIARYHRDACKLLITISPFGEEATAKFDEYSTEFGEHICGVLRKSDLVMQYKRNQYFVFLTDIKEEAISQVIGNILRIWNEKRGNILNITYETEFLRADKLEESDGNQLWVVMVDDDVTNLKVAGHILCKNGMRVTGLTSGNALLDFIRDKHPDLILLDVNMPEMNGFETLQKLRAEETGINEIPVVFLTADDDKDAERRGLSLGAMDFIKKPFVPEVLTLRVRQIVELLRLQKNLAQEVAHKTKENEDLFIHVVRALADAIDAKDTYTKGHSSRVADYAKEIAKRYGYNTKEQGDIYIMGLLHDVGKIGVPDHIINKWGRLSDEEFESIKKHPVIGAQILKNIKEMPNLHIGTRWHHERFGGGGYPDGLVGEQIPEEARIIAVADAYDAMTSNRSYRQALPQEAVRNEIEKGKGSQFDPRFADIMLKMIDEDRDYLLKER